MATTFMTEEEAEAIIEANKNKLVKKITCASAAMDSIMDGPGSGTDESTGTTCGCC